VKSWTPAHFPSADQRNRSYDRKRSALRWFIAAVAAFVAGGALEWIISRFS